MTRRLSWRTVAVLVAGLASAIAAVAGVRAAPARAAGLFSYDLTAGARGWSMYYDDPTGLREGEGTVPETSAGMSTGPLGKGLATIFWPGPAGGNAGSLVFVLKPDAPKELQYLNDPVKAESRIGDDPPEQSYDNLPGTTMASSATKAKVTADAAVKNAAGDASTFGPTTAHSENVLTDTSATSDAKSRVEDISLAAGVVKIESVTSVAHAVSDGVKGDGNASTKVEGLTIGGQAATIDESGVHIGDQGQPANAVANQIAQQALAKSGAELVLSAPIKEIDGATATVDAGSLLVTWKTPGGTFGAILGGARASATAGPGLDDALTGGDAVGTTSDLGVTPSDGSGGDPGSAAVDLPATGSADTSTPTTGRAAGGGNEAALRTEPIAAIGRPVQPWWVLLGLLSACLIGFGLKRLSDEVLVERTSTCPLQDGEP